MGFGSAEPGYQYTGSDRRQTVHFKNDKPDLMKVRIYTRN